MLRLVLLLLYLVASYSSGDLTGNLDPNGLDAQSPPSSSGDVHGNLDPDG